VDRGSESSYDYQPSPEEHCPAADDRRPTKYFAAVRIGVYGYV